MSGKEIPFLSGRREKDADYIPFRYTHAYIKQKSDNYNGPQNALMEKCGYANLTKFIKHRKLWDALVKPVPLSYLREIRVDLKTVRFTLDLDREAFEKAVARPLYAENFLIKLPGFFGTVNFESALPEEEAIQRTIAYVNDKKLTCLVPFGEIKTIYVYPSGKTASDLHRPEIKVNKTKMEFCGTARNEGKIYLL